MATTSKVSGTIQATGQGPNYVHAIDDWGVWHFIHKSNVSAIGALGFDDLKPGSRVRFLSVPQPRGKYVGLEVEVIEV